jgi:hypothetical protein
MLIKLVNRFRIKFRIWKINSQFKTKVNFLNNRMKLFRRKLFKNRKFKGFKLSQLLQLCLS